MTANAAGELTGIRVGDQSLGRDFSKLRALIIDLVGEAPSPAEREKNEVEFDCDYKPQVRIHTRRHHRRFRLHQRQRTGPNRRKHQVLPAAGSVTPGRWVFIFRRLHQISPITARLANITQLPGSGIVLLVATRNPRPAILSDLGR